MRRMSAKAQIFQLKIQLCQIRPPVWRRVLVPAEMTLADLHEVMQVAMGWTDSHLHEFDIDGVRYGVPNSDWGLDEVRDECRVKLFRVAGERSRFLYAYDFGDGWKHDLTVEKLLRPDAGTRYPCCIGVAVPARQRTWAGPGDTNASWRP